MTTPRAQLVDPDIPYAYHLMSRCVRRSFLCGKDAATQKDYTHRKQWLINRINHLAQYFAVEVYAYTIMSNHFHMVVYYDPNAADRWDDPTIAQRWCEVCPPKTRTGDVDLEAKDALYSALLEDPDALARARQALGSLSVFMQLLKQPIAYRANREDACTGHFFEQRFYSGVLLDEAAVVEAMGYVDLNPVRAQLARHLREIKHSSITQRMRKLSNSKTRIERALAKTLMPLVSGLEESDSQDSGSQQPARPKLRLSMGLEDYTAHLKAAIRAETKQITDPKHKRWVERLKLYKRRQRAYGSSEQINEWIEHRGFTLREVARV